MNFFEHQDRARRSTALLVFLFGLAVLAIICAVSGVIGWAWLLMQPSRGFQDLLAEAARGEGVLFTAAACTTLFIGLVSFGQIMGLSGGGKGLAAMMGGRRLDPATTDPGEKRFLNVIQEMSLASGIAVPEAYVLPEESSINAFAAGTIPSNAVVAVSRGCLDRLNRDELQGVVAHEFSHIFNGDMRLNVRLIGVLSGILALAMVGRGLLEATGNRRSRRSGKDGAGAVVAVGLALLVIGYIGVFFAQLIKSAVSRQREFLADASAVQFTRNPAGILGALVKIRDGAGSRLESASTEKVSHLLFASGISSWFATHPPLEARIRAIDASHVLEPRLSVSSVAAAPASAMGFSGAPVPPPSPEAVVSFVGLPGPESLLSAEKRLKSFPQEVLSALAIPAGARAVVYSLLLDRDDHLRERQVSHLGEEMEETLRLFPAVSGTPRSSRFALTELAVPALRGIPVEGRDPFRARLHAAAVEDNRLEPFEVLLESFIQHVLSSESTHKPSPGAGVLLLSFLARAGGESVSEAAFKKGMEVWRPGVRAAIPPALETGPEDINGALLGMASASPSERRRLIEAAAACVLADGQALDAEWETLRVFGAILECPLPAVFQEPS